MRVSADSEPPPRANSSVSSDTFGFEAQVRDALSHLHDPSHLQSHPLTRFVHAYSPSRLSSLGHALQQDLLDTVEVLRPSAEAHPSSRARRTYEILTLRYVDALDVAQVLDRLALSRSLYYLEHGRAVNAVSALLWERWGLGGARAPTTRQQAQPGRESDAERSEREQRRGTASQPPVLTNLPVQLTSFVGREREISEVTQLLGTTRLLTLTGTGGCGKTRLAVECVRSLVDTYPDGVWLVALAGLADPYLVPSAIAATLDIREEPGTPLLNTLARQLRAWHCILVLDNCEHLLDACAQVAAALLERCPHLKILATSRQTLVISGETAFRVPPLSAPPKEVGRSREDLLRTVLSHDATRLFVERARASSPSFELGLGNASTVAEICRRLDGIPLAIELAATRVRALAPDQIAHRLDHDFHLLTGGSRAALPRQQTLKATLDWSHDLLPDRERVLLRRLSVFVGGFTLEAAEAVATGEGIEELEVVDLLTQLVDKSLVEAEERENAARYRLLEPVRQYAWHRLEESGEAPSVRDQHGAWCLDLARGAEDGAQGPDMPLSLDRVETEHDNLRAALGWGLAHDVETGLDLVGSLAWFWGFHCYFHEGSRWAAALLGGSARETLPRARALRAAAMMLAGEGDVARAVELAEESLRLCRQLDDRRELARSLLWLARIIGSSGQQDRCEQLLGEAMRLGSEVGDYALVGDCFFSLGAFAHERGDRDRARPLIEESLAISRRIGDLHMIAYALMRSGRMELTDGDRARARQLLEEALGIFQRERYAFGIGGAQILLAYLALLEGHHEEAKELALRALALAGSLGGWAQRHALELAVALEVRAGSHQRGVRLFGAMDAESRDNGAAFQPFFRGAYDGAIAAARAALGDEAFARAWAEGQAMTLEQAVEYALDEAEA